MEQMKAEQAISLLGNIAGWDIDSGERGNDKREATKLAIDALEKQVPKKIVTGKSTYGMSACPACSLLLPIVNMDFCNHCGQALDWPE